MDASGKLVIQPQFGKVADFSEGLAMVCVGRCDYTETSHEWEGDKLNTKGGDYEGKWGYIDTSGKMVISPQFDGAGPFSTGLAAVFVGKRKLAEADIGKYGYIDVAGKFVAEPQFGHAYSFDKDSGLAIVCVGKCSYDDNEKKFGFVNRSGKFVINPQFDDVEEFIGGLARVSMGHDKEIRIGYINRSGNFVWNPQN
jgi:hypothetical protein